MSIRHCSRCNIEILSSDLVMKARENLYHVDCFRCSSCDVTLVKGDYFGMYSEALFCRTHYEEYHESGCLPEESSNDHVGHHYDPNMSQYHPVPWGGGGYGWYPPSHTLPYGSPTEYFENNNKPPVAPFKKRRGRKKRKTEIDSNPFESSGSFGMDGTSFPGGSDLSGLPKTKRARTSFKHHQLRIMKAHFQINQNPDSRELKMLSQKTGLDKKVLQVWFQNSRAKWRRTKQDGLPPGASGSEDSMSLGMGGDASSPASDCSGPMIPCC